MLGLLAGVLAGGCHRQPEVAVLHLRHEPFHQRVKAEGNLEAVENAVITAPMLAGRRQKIVWLINDGARVKKGDVVIRFDPIEFEKEKQDGLEDRRILELQRRRSEIETEIKLKNLEKDQKLCEDEAKNAGSFESTDTRTFSKNEIIESAIDTRLAEDRATHARESRNLNTQLSRAEIALLEIEAKKVDLKIQRAEDGLQGLKIAAPQDGFVVFERDWQGNIPRVGEETWPGQPLASIPKTDAMQAAVYVLEADAGGLAAGQNASFTLDAHPDRVFKAKVSSVEPVAQRRVRWVPVQYFRALLLPDVTDKSLMKPGQRLHADITIAEESSVISVPRQAVTKVDGETVVYRLEDGSFQPQKVVIGASAFGKVVISEGLHDGDVIALRNPTQVIEKSTAPSPTLPGAS